MSDLFVDNGKVISEEFLDLFKTRAVELIHVYETADVHTNEVTRDNHYVLGTVVDRLNNFIMELKRVEKEISQLRSSSASRADTRKRSKKYLS